MVWWFILLDSASTLVILITFIYGTRNFIRYKHQIWSNRTLYYFYIFGLVCLFCLVP